MPILAIKPSQIFQGCKQAKTSCSKVGTRFSGTLTSVFQRKAYSITYQIVQARMARAIQRFVELNPRASEASGKHQRILKVKFDMKKLR